MRKLFKKSLPVLASFLPYAIVVSVLLATIFFPSSQEQKKEEVKRVVRIWHIDTFEGGKGSRASFLKDAARVLEKKDENVYYLVTAYTIEGARSAFNAGDKPDLISFGIGLGDCIDACLPLSYSFSGGEVGGRHYAYPWCAGRYSLFSLDEDFDDEGDIVVSVGGSNLSSVAAALNGCEGTAIASTTAYVEFLNGKWRYLLGTQRDECRFQTRGVTVYRKELSEFCDLYQYISCLNGEKLNDCKRFVETLLSDEVQSKLSSIGMFPVSDTTAKNTVSVFSSDAALRELERKAREDTTEKNLNKFLKKV